MTRARIIRHMAAILKSKPARLSAALRGKRRDDEAAELIRRYRGVARLMTNARQLCRLISKETQQTGKRKTKKT